MGTYWALRGGQARGSPSGTAGWCGWRADPPWHHGQGRDADARKRLGAEAEVVAVCTQGLNLFRTLCVYLKPVLPTLTERAERLLGAGELGWADAGRPLVGRRIERFEPLLTRVDSKTIETIVAESRVPEPAAAAPGALVPE